MARPHTLSRSRSATRLSRCEPSLQPPGEDPCDRIPITLTPELTDLPAQRSDSRPALDQPLSTAPRSSPDRLRNRDAEITSNDRYRLAGAASGTGRSSGSLLDEAAATLDWSPDINYNDPERLKEVARQYRERTARAFALEEAALELNEAVRRAATVRKRIERRQETQRRRAERGTTKKSRRPSRPVKVDVDPDGVGSREARRRSSPMVDGRSRRRARALAVQDGVIPRNRPQLTSAQDPAGAQQSQQSSAQSDCAAALCKGRIFARLFVDEETWAQFRVLAFDAHVPIARLVGLLVEREARNIKNRENR